jgi:hypothetical protein
MDNALKGAIISFFGRAWGEMMNDEGRMMNREQRRENRRERVFVSWKRKEERMRGFLICDWRFEIGDSFLRNERRNDRRVESR